MHRWRTVRTSPERPLDASAAPARGRYAVACGCPTLATRWNSLFHGRRALATGRNSPLRARRAPAAGWNGVLHACRALATGWNSVLHARRAPATGWNSVLHGRRAPATGRGSAYHHSSTLQAQRASLVTAFAIGGRQGARRRGPAERRADAAGRIGFTR